MSNKALNEHIEYITEALEASNQAFFSGTHLIFSGIGFILIPCIEWVFSKVLDISLWQQYTQVLSTNIILHCLFYWSIFFGIKKFSDHITGQKTVFIGHPLIKKAFAAHVPIMYSILGVVITFFIMGYDNLIFPMVFILLGITLNLYGRFATKTISHISWSFILVGFVGILLSKANIDYLWMIGTTYLGLSYIIMGYSCKAKVSQNEK